MPGDLRRVGGGGDVRGCHGMDRRVDGYIGLYGVDSLLAQPSVNLLILWN